MYFIFPFKYYYLFLVQDFTLHIFENFVYLMRDLESRIRQTANVNLYHVTNFPLTLRFTVHYLYLKISSFALVLSIKIGLNCFYLHVVYIEKLSTWIWRLPFAVNGTLNLSNFYPNKEYSLPFERRLG